MITFPTPSFGLTAAQFFGLGLPFARHAIEIIPESCAAIICPPPVPQYQPSYRLPSKVYKNFILYCIISYYIILYYIIL